MKPLAFQPNMIELRLETLRYIFKKERKLPKIKYIFILYNIYSVLYMKMTDLTVIYLFMRSFSIITNSFYECVKEKYWDY